jgi:predicted  nucleic acid-binding Zn-ribbon protein
MVHCERCGSRFHSARALIIENCPRCLLRDDVMAPLVVESVEEGRVEMKSPPPGPEAPVGPLEQEPA